MPNILNNKILQYPSGAHLLPKIKLVMKGLYALFYKRIDQLTVQFGAVMIMMEKVRLQCQLAIGTVRKSVGIYFEGLIKILNGFHIKS